jgi:DNA-binding CsgD family transcriptional regulator
LEAIARSVEGAMASRGSAVALSGPLGIGKTRLLREAARLADVGGLRVISAAGDELERDFPFGVVLSLFEPFAARVDADVQRARFRGRAEVAAPLLSGDTGALPTWDAGDEFALLHALYWFVVNLSEEQPLALLIDDIQWADAMSLRFLVYLAQRLQGLPLLLVVALRTGSGADAELVGRLVAAAGPNVVQLEALSLAAVSEIVGASSDVEAQPEEDFPRVCWELTGGNPFLVGALSSAVTSGDVHWKGEESLTSFAPSEVRRVLVAHIARTHPAAPAFARASAVLGAAATVERATAIAGLDEETALLVLERLAAADVLVAEGVIRFSHPMYRSAVYADMSPADRARLHAMAARVLHGAHDADDHVAQHLVRGASVEEAWASETLHRAGRLAAQRGAPTTAVRMLRRALEIRIRESPPAALLRDLAHAEAASGETISLQHFTAAAEASDTLREKAEVLCSLGQTLFRYGRVSEAAAVLDRGRRMVGDEDTEYRLAYEASYFAAATYDPHLFFVTEEQIEAVSAPLIDKAQLTRAERGMLANLAMRRALSGAPAATTAALARQALGDPDAQGDLSERMALYSAMEALLYCGCFDDATATIDRFIDDARKRGSALALAQASLLRAMTMRARGNIHEAMSDALTAIEGIDFGYRSDGSTPHAVLAECHLDRGDLEAASRVLGLARDQPPPFTEALLAFPLMAEGRYLLASGRPVEAFEVLCDAGRRAAQHGMVNPAIVPWRSLAVQAALAIDRPNEARRLADEELDAARSFGAPWVIGRALRARSRVESGPGQIPMLIEAVSMLEGSGAELELAITLGDLGSALRRAGQRTNARERLRRALDRAHRCGAIAIERRARDELQASGARPRRAVLSGLEALTPSERRIAQLAAEGLTNRAIAESLFLTKNTVDWHLRNAYRKLEVRSRDQLRCLLGPSDPSVDRAGGGDFVGTPVVGRPSGS